MPVTAQLMTVEEFCQLPESEAYVAELRNGEVFQLTRPVKRHDARVTRIRQGMQPFANKPGFLREEFTFRPLPEYEVRVADLGLVSWDRWDPLLRFTVPEDSHLLGSPEFIVEVASPSNSAHEVSSATVTQTCQQEGSIPFTVFLGQTMSLAYVFTLWC